MQTKLTPAISTLDLGRVDRVIGGLMEMEIPDNSDQASIDLAGDTFHQLYQDHKPASSVAPQRAVNRSLLDWAQGTQAYQDLLKDTRNSLPGSLLAGQMLHLTMQTDEAMKAAMEKQSEADQANEAAEEAERRAKAEQAMQTPTAEQAQQIADALRQQADQQMAEAAAYANQIQQNPLNRGIMGAAVKKAAGEAKEVNQVFGGWGHGPGSPLMRDPKSSLAFMQKHDAKTKRIAKYAGRMRGIGMNARREQVAIGRTPAGIEYTQDLGRVLDSEIAMLTQRAPRLMRLTKMAEFADSGLLGRKLEDIKDEAGCFVFGVDVSGSMYGEREESAKGVGLGLAQIAQTDGRTYELFSFSSGRDNLIRCSSSDNWEKHLEWAGKTIAGGTSFDIALEEIMRVLIAMGEKGHNADAVLSSDGEAAVSTEVAAKWKAFAQATGARLLYVPVAEGYGSLEKLADRVLPVEDTMDDETMKVASTWMR